MQLLLGLIPGAAGAAAPAFSLATILQGTASVLGLVASISAGNADAAQAELAAADAEREQATETLSGIDRRRSLLAGLRDALGAQDVAYAASGVDLSFGTAAQARTDAFREADLGLTSDTGTEMTRGARLMERAANYRSAAKRAKIGGFINGFGGFLSNASQIAGRV